MANLCFSLLSNVYLLLFPGYSAILLIYNLRFQNHFSVCFLSICQNTLYMYLRSICCGNRCSDKCSPSFKMQRIGYPQESMPQIPEPVYQRQFRPSFFTRTAIRFFLQIAHSLLYPARMQYIHKHDRLHGDHLPKCLHSYKFHRKRQQYISLSQLHPHRNVFYTSQFHPQ